jgi:bifunctional non-homologous end joining protein LigD
MTPIEPMECKPVRDLSHLPHSDEWQFEVKFDGYRCIAIKRGKEVALYSRNLRRFNQFPNLIEAIASLKNKNVILDGEVVALDENGRTDFNALQNVGRGAPVHFFAFDLLELNGKDWKERPLVERQETLGAKIEGGEFVHVAGPIKASLEMVAAKVVEFGFEGVVAKKRDSIYLPGKAPWTWLKKKIKETEEFIIGGYIPGAGGIDTIVVGRFSGKE